jgi:hypothetical protein
MNNAADIANQASPTPAPAAGMGEREVVEIINRHYREFMAHGLHRPSGDWKNEDETLVISEDAAGHPTHWMPLPDPPVTAPTEKG